MAATIKVGKNFAECTACGEFFFSVGSFDKHLVRTRGGNTRCMTPVEMEAVNLEKNKQGYWVTAKGFGKG